VAKAGEYAAVVWIEHSEGVFGRVMKARFDPVKR